MSSHAVRSDCTYVPGAVKVPGRATAATAALWAGQRCVEVVRSRPQVKGR